ncbi:hypothetical protein H4R20_001378, partial [Coemansia guatemalensis]
ADSEHVEEPKPEVNVVQPHREENAQREDSSIPEPFVEYPSTGNHPEVITTNWQIFPKN